MSDKRNSGTSSKKRGHTDNGIDDFQVRRTPHSNPPPPGSFTQATAASGGRDVGMSYPAVQHHGGAYAGPVPMRPDKEIQQPPSFLDKTQHDDHFQKLSNPTMTTAQMDQIQSPPSVASDYGTPLTSPINQTSHMAYPQVGDSTPNVIVFGETGVGKSSLINMIAGKEMAIVSSGALGCTFASTPHDVMLEHGKYRLWDTIGLNEGEHGTATAERAIQNLQDLVMNLKDGGVSLLVYCIRGTRFRDILKINYDLFQKIICDEKVPIVVVVTGLENEGDMEDWWSDNAHDFGRRDMRFVNHACVTTTKGKLTKSGEYMFEEEYNVSTLRVRELIESCCSKQAWKPDGTRWLGGIIENMRRMYDQDVQEDAGPSPYEGQRHAGAVPGNSTHAGRATHGRSLGYVRYIIRQILLWALSSEWSSRSRSSR
ncbi:hypothetical protein AX17_003856 [Amanita inopinata Kibby_2008]|nr:hypothetical protein AX17_003856 [Amanita inopinata Kibby_2008]